MKQAEAQSRLTQVPVFINAVRGFHGFDAHLASSVGAVFLPQDSWIHWTHHSVRNYSTMFRRFSNDLIGLVQSYKLRKYSAILTENLLIWPVVAKYLGLLGTVPLVARVDGEQLYFMLHTDVYPAWKKDIFIKLLRGYDAFICASRFLGQLLEDCMRPQVKIQYCPNFIFSDRLERLKNVAPNHRSNTLVTIGSGADIRRLMYKGLDLTLSAANIVAKEFPIKLLVIGWERDKVPRSWIPDGLHVQFLGAKSDIWTYLQGASLYIHPARGEAFGVSVIEAMAAGLIPVVSKWTGAAEAVQKLDPALIVDIDANEVASKIVNTLSRPVEDRLELSSRARSVVLENYQEQEVVARFQGVWKSILAELTNHEKNRVE